MMRVPANALLALLLVASATACSSGGNDQAARGDSGLAAVAEEGDASGDTASGTTGAGGGSAQSLQLSSLRAAPGVAVIRTAELEVRVDDVRTAAEAAARLARTAGGGVEAEERSGSGTSGSATLSLRVPPVQFDKTIGALAGLGDERSRRLGSEDVTDQVVDLEARLATQRASVERVRALLAEADALGEVVQIEGELTKRTADLEALQARLESLTGRIDLSTITLHLHSHDDPVAGEALGFGDGLRAGWSALVTAGRVVAVTAGALLPFLPLAAVGLFFLWRSRTRRTQAAQP